MENIKEVSFLVVKLILVLAAAVFTFSLAVACAAFSLTASFVNRHMWPIAFMVVGFAAIYCFS